VDRVGCSSGSWHELVYCIDEYADKRIPNDTSDFGRHFYVGGDFNAGRRYVTRAEFKEALTQVEEYFTKLAEYIEGKIKEETESTARLKKLVQAIEQQK